jgi:threonine synthase
VETLAGPAFEGCAACAQEGPPAALEVAYDYPALRGEGILAAWVARPGGLWRFRELLPLPAGAPVLTLAEGATPLVPLEGAGAARVWLKDETRNPTGAFKDRLHAVSLAMARALGYRGATASTTGNHGTALAAYAASAGLRAVVFCDPRAPALQRRLMQLHGARVVVLPGRDEHLAWLVRERGWYPSTGMTPAPVGTPYGVEGYKTIAYEIYFQLGARFPARVLVPTSGGDAVYGPWKGFRELRALGAAGPLPRMVAVQASGCDPIVRGWRAGAREVPVHPDPRTIAVSIADDTGGPASLRALAESGLRVSRETPSHPRARPGRPRIATGSAHERQVPDQSTPRKPLALAASRKRPILVGEQTGAGRDLPGVLVASFQAIGDQNGGAHFLKRERADPHPGVECDRHPSQVAQLHRRGADPARLEHRRRGVDRDSQSRDRRTSFQATQQVIRQFQALHGRSQREVTRLHHERLVRRTLDRPHRIADRLRLPRVDV